MRFMIIVRSIPEFEAETTPSPDPAVFDAMLRFHQELARAGVLLDASGLHPSRKGWQVRHGQGAPRIVDGPFAEAKELIAGYTLIQVRSRDEAIEWSRRFPNPVGEGKPATVEVRQLVDLDEIQADGPSVEAFRQMLQT
ncbi:MAG: YciI family protein [Hydrogenophaga sp.]|uniref:YciI family protein n=1 Tax=Hydrogenophaga sp. TaxID=1904254 RepID=UPI00169D1E73|nr:YciI family protein [Hydrogenophaga sp.]NIM40569.1 YciI family protein [Hydrogenophaga sp.]NIN25987.1 YciI family protein [Hydrogenophaga sp.]NIN30859.1 YciI family protein [Hydrogenophaga sp.]NIN54952.1 YciI family protein [Hydrogenophaga sp.]NIO50992.1 YciI family protein [Hydrogenophaga sp.]